MRINSGFAPEIIDLAVKNNTASLIAANTVVYYNDDGLTITATPNNNPAGTLINDVAPNGGTGYARKMGPLNGTYIPLSGGGGGSATEVQLDPDTEPTANLANAGKIIYTAGGAGVADMVRICLKNDDDTYSWFPLA